jgi:hypothetical protein
LKNDERNERFIRKIENILIVLEKLTSKAFGKEGLNNTLKKKKTRGLNTN